MKTFGRLIRRYVLAAVGMVLVLAVLCVGFIVWLGWRESTHTPQAEYSSGVIADAMVQTAQGLAFGPEHTPEEWMDGYAWAMVLDDDGDVVLCPAGASRPPLHPRRRGPLCPVVPR